jgi:hypothetical protein
MENQSQAVPRQSSRIPSTLQAVFLASNRGKDVNAPPPQRVAFKTFFRGWLGRSDSKNKKQQKGGGKCKPEHAKKKQKKEVKLEPVIKPIITPKVPKAKVRTS